MTSLKPFEKTLKNIRKTGKIAYGFKESLSSSDQSKLVICSSTCLLYTSPSPRDATLSRMPSSA